METERASERTSVCERERKMETAKQNGPILKSGRQALVVLLVPPTTTNEYGSGNDGGGGNGDTVFDTPTVTMRLTDTDTARLLYNGEHIAFGK